MLEYVLKMLGSKRITFGSDYPFPLGELGKFIEEMELDKETKKIYFIRLPWSGLG